MKRSYMIAAAIGTAAVIAVTGTALAAADDPGTPSAGPAGVAPSGSSALPGRSAPSDSVTPADDSTTPADDSGTPFDDSGTPFDDSGTPSDDGGTAFDGSSALPPDDGSGPPGSVPSEAPLPFETVEPGSVTPTPRSSRSASSGLGSAPRGSVSAEQARARALSAVGGGRVTKIEAETEHGRPVWEVEVIHDGVEHDLDIDRETGAITDHDSDHDDHRGRGRGRGGDDRRG